MNNESTSPSSSLKKSNVDWGLRQAENLWIELFERYSPHIDQSVILDLGCSWGYMQMFLHKRFNPQKTIGVDLTPLWDEMNHGWDYKALDKRIEFYCGPLANQHAIQDGTLDYIFCTSVLQYMRVEMILATLEKAFDLLKPGGEVILRTRCFPSRSGADMHSYYELDFMHLLYSMSEIKNDLQAWKGIQPRYLNYLCASNYVALFYQSGFEIVDINFRNSKPQLDIFKKMSLMYPWVDIEDLNCAEVEARLIKPKNINYSYTIAVKK